MPNVIVSPARLRRRHGWEAEAVVELFVENLAGTCSGRATAQPGRQGARDTCRRDRASSASRVHAASRVIEVAGCASPTATSRRCAGSTCTSTAARCSRCSAPTAPARPRRSRSSRATASATAGEVSVLGHDPATRERALQERIGIVLQSTGVDPYLTVRETVELYARLLPGAARRRRGHRRWSGSTEKRDARVQQALGRPAAASGRGDRAGRRPRAAVPRRADDRVRSRRAPQRVGDRPRT